MLPHSTAEKPLELIPKAQTGGTREPPSPPLSPSVPVLGVLQGSRSNKKGKAQASGCPELGEGSRG